MDTNSTNCLVLDVGKTNIKVHVLDGQQRSLATYTKDNKSLVSPPYPHVDIDGIWQWMMEVFASCSVEHAIDAMVVTAHGATAALVDTTLGGNGLVLPIVDYEWSGSDVLNDTYEEVRPLFQETCSPSLPDGLNLGRQLAWQQDNFPQEFNSAEALLMYPQYWTWRLSGKLVSEVSSLGCHTDLWSPTNNDFSSLVARRGWRHLFPPLASAWESVGTISAAVVAATGLPESCRVHVGVHDSNASFLRFLLANPGEEFCVVSSGTWVVCMSNEDSLHYLDPTKDMLANVDVKGESIPCIRFMGGREYAEICDLTGTTTSERATAEDIERIVADGVMALPNFSSGSGPFGDRRPEVLGEPHNGAALATLYCALMVDHCLDLLHVSGDVFIVGAYLQNPLLCNLVAQLRHGQPVYISSDEAGTVRGAAQLSAWSKPVSLTTRRCAPTEIEGLEDYCTAWHEKIGGIT